jgi:hypothetical protein
MHRVFRCKNDDGTIRKLYAYQTEARIFHYGWVRHRESKKRSSLHSTVYIMMTSGWKRIYLKVMSLNVIAMKYNHLHKHIPK